MPKRKKLPSRILKRNKRSIALQRRWGTHPEKIVREDPDVLQETEVLSSSNILLENVAGPSFCSSPILEFSEKCVEKELSVSDHGSDVDLIPLEDIWMENEEYDSIMEHELCVEKEDLFTSTIPGHRIVDLGYVLKWAVNLQYKHSQTCTGTLYPCKEESRGLGLVRYIHFKCTLCNETEIHATEDPNKPTSLINVGAVWGTLATGSTYGHLEELLCCMDIPPLPKKMFIDTENFLGEVWQDQYAKDIDSAHEQERTIAVEKGDVDPDGVPYITVILDGGWSKRSYGHNYNAMSGVAVIVGFASGKILYVGVRNKYCAICARAYNRKQLVKDHKCFRNWSGSSPAMEADMIVQGFCLAEEVHKIRYKYFIADGDSSVYAKIVEKVPYGREVRKSECMNHALKNYGKVLHQLRNDTKINLIVRKQLLQKNIKELQKTAQSAIYNCGAAEELKEDLRNGPLHVYGHHSSCKNYYCRTVGCVAASRLEEIKKSGCYNYIYGALEGLLKKSGQLVDKLNNNKAEIFMNIVARFNQGKRMNLITRGSYERRCHLSRMRYDKSFNWHTSPWKKATLVSPGKHFKDYIKRHQREKDLKVKRPLFTKKKEKIGNLPNIDYGTKAQQPEPTDAEISFEIQELLKKLQVTKEEQIFIEQNTKEQFESDLYRTERANRLTASNFGAVIKKRMSTSCHNLVKQVLYTTGISTESIDYGKTMETVAIKKLESTLNVNVRKSGLFVYLQHGCLGASPDGLVGDTHIVEVKCLHKVAKLGITLKEAVEKDICLELSNDMLRLKRNHQYYYQVQGQLNITGRQFCYFVVYVNDNTELFIEEIQKDDLLWADFMLPCLLTFYKDCVAQEVIRRRIPKDQRCFDPPSIIEAQKKVKKKNV